VPVTSFLHTSEPDVVTAGICDLVLFLVPGAASSSLDYLPIYQPSRLHTWSPLPAVAASLCRSTASAQTKLPAPIITRPLYSRAWYIICIVLNLHVPALFDLPHLAKINSQITALAPRCIKATSTKNRASLFHEK
jgi:hypothetical protein